MLQSFNLPHLTNNPLLNRAWFYRGITDISEMDLSIKGLLPINSLSQIDLLAKKLLHYVQNKKRIVIIADYDCDGATSCAVMARMLMSLGANVGWLVPDRAVHGYGLSTKIVEHAHQGLITGDAKSLKEQEEFVKNNVFQLASQDLPLFKAMLDEKQDSDLLLKTSVSNSVKEKPDVLLTVDNGTASIEGVNLARQLGMDVLITDHHLAGHTLPDAIVVNPNHPDCTFKSKALCGVGVAWYVCIKLAQLAKEAGLNPMSPTKLLPLVTLGTVADVVSLDQNNRIIVANGLSHIRHNSNFVGLEALIMVSDIQKEYFSTMDIGFKIGPRINAAGRIENMGIGILNLITDDPQVALITAYQLNHLNEVRKEITRNVTDDGEKILSACNLRNYEDDFVIVLYPESRDIEWHEGVIGIAAGRLKEKYNKPSIVMTYIDKEHAYKGSCRSIPKLHFKDLLDEVALRDPDIFIKYGGHAMAAGLTINADKINDFVRIINELAKTKLHESDFVHYLISDGNVSLNELSVKNVTELQSAVWGQNFTYPQFNGKYEIMRIKRMGAGEQHVKVTLKQGNYYIDAVRFNCPDWIPQERTTTTFLFQPTLNIYNGNINVNLLIQAADFDSSELVTLSDLETLQNTQENKVDVGAANQAVSKLFELIEDDKNQSESLKVTKNKIESNSNSLKDEFRNTKAHYANPALQQNTIPDF